MTINPYLNFEGDCEAAFDFYKSVFGNDFQFVGRFNEMPADYKVPEGFEEKIMHISLPINDHVTLMGSDVIPGMGKPFQMGGNIQLSINLKADENADSVFAKLAENGEIVMPLSNTFWGAYFGMLTDQFGITWQINQAQNS